jgi:hypothetical protein
MDLERLTRDLHRAADPGVGQAAGKSGVLVFARAKPLLITGIYVTISLRTTTDFLTNRGSLDPQGRIQREGLDTRVTACRAVAL